MWCFVVGLWLLMLGFWVLRMVVVGVVCLAYEHTSIVTYDRCYCTVDCMKALE